jgi:nucleoredoxin
VLVTNLANAREGKGVAKIKLNASELFETVSPHLVDSKGDAVDGKKVMNKPYLLFYYSAHWCGPCRRLTPKLVAFYKAHGGGDKFEVILVSNDRSEAAMKKYMIKEKMPWYAIDYEQKKSINMKKFAARGIPNLMLIDRQGNQLARGQSNVLTKLEALLK